MKTMSDLKKEYESVPVPEEGRQRLEESILQAKKDRKKHRWIRLAERGTAGVVAAAAVLLVLGLNTNEAFARELSEVPVVCVVARVLTVRSYEERDRNVVVKVEVPEIQTETEQEKQSGIQDINQRIQQIAEEYVEKTKAEAEEYRQAFLETGGTEEEWEAREIEIFTGYEVKSQTDTTLSLSLLCAQSWASYYGSHVYFNVDLETGKEITLEELLGENYIEVANESIKEQMHKRMEEDENIIYWTEEDEVFGAVGFQSISEDTKFYINQAGNPVVVFDKYEIAPGYMGEPEFEITADIK